eukprot:scaffold34354_cov172-Isochrysis_galbana.AAC.3
MEQSSQHSTSTLTLREGHLSKGGSGQFTGTEQGVEGIDWSNEKEGGWGGAYRVGQRECTEGRAHAARVQCMRLNTMTVCEHSRREERMPRGREERMPRGCSVWACEYSKRVNTPCDGRVNTGGV